MKTIFFDMGGTIEDIWYDEQTKYEAVRSVRDILHHYGINLSETDMEASSKLFEGIYRYKDWSERNCRELKPEEIWPQYYLAWLGKSAESVREFAEELAGMWEVTYYHRELRPGAKKMLDELSHEFRLGVISNTASLYSVFDVLEAYGIREYFETVTLSSVTGYRKPNEEIFRIALREMRANPESSIYVGDTISRDVIGARRAGFAKTVQIKSFLSPEKDEGVPETEKPDYVIETLMDLVPFAKGQID